MACLLVLRCSALVGGAVCPAAVAGSMDSVATGPSATNRRSSQNDWQKRSAARSEEHTSELQSPCNLVCRLLLEKKKNITYTVEHKPIRPRNITDLLER